MPFLEQGMRSGGNQTAEAKEFMGLHKWIIFSKKYEIKSLSSASIEAIPNGSGMRCSLISRTNRKQIKHECS